MASCRIRTVAKQYGLWGAERYAGTFSCTDACSNGDSVITDGIIQSRITSLIPSVLPPATPNTLYVVFLKGFSYNLPGAAYHSAIASTGPYYAVIPYENITGHQDNDPTGPSFEQSLSHEIFEAATDPNQGGWVSGTFEGGDECQPFAGYGRVLASWHRSRGVLRRRSLTMLAMFSLELADHVNASCIEMATK